MTSLTTTTTSLWGTNESRSAGLSQVYYWNGQVPQDCEEQVRQEMSSQDPHDCEEQVCQELSSLIQVPHNCEAQVCWELLSQDPQDCTKQVRYKQIFLTI